MYLKKKLMKAASICSYVCSAIWFVAAASAFALSDYTYWLFLIFALLSLYGGFAVTSIREKMTGVILEKKQNTLYLICWILSIVALPSFILNAIAYFRKTEDELVVIRQNVAQKEEPAPEREPEKKKPFYKTKCFVTMCVAFLLVFVCSFSAMIFETSGFSVKVSDFTLTKEMTETYNEGKIHGKAYTMENDTTYSVTMYVPSNATEENPAATVFVVPGFTRTKATMAQYCIELSRRGAVVFSLDPGGQGGTTETSTAGANGVEYLVQYVYNNTDDFKFCDKSRFGAIKAAIACGRRVPEDISVIGIDNIDSSAVSKPSLTTLDQSGNRYGAKIFEILHNDIVAGTSGKYIVPMRLIKRESTGTAPQNAENRILLQE